LFQNVLDAKGKRQLAFAQIASEEQTMAAMQARMQSTQCGV
jgi:hypothetical protein